VGNRVTLKTIAETVGVSRTTVSNAYNRPDQLAPELRDRILGTARRLGYAGPDPAARRLRSGRRDAVGLLLADGLASAFDDPAAVILLQGVARATEAAGLAILVLPAGNGVQDAVVDSFCLLSLAADHPDVVAAQARGVPLVAVDEPRLPGHAYVGVDDRLGGRLAAEHLLGLGHRRFAIAPAGGAAGAQRLGGYRDALEAAGLDWGVVPRVVAFAGPERPTAVLAATDRLALGVLEAAREAGLRLPEDLSVVGFDDIPAAAQARLTTVRQPLFEKGQAAGRLLTEGAASREVILPVELVVRGSTAAPA
jgi:DNA-binding LacI/PurR family transcriptional regulator